MSTAKAAHEPPRQARTSRRVRRRLQHVMNAVLPLAIIGLVLSSWEILGRTLDVPTYLLPTPSLIAQEVVAQRHVLFDNIRVTIVEVLLGLLLALVAGIGHGMALGYSRIVRRATYPIIVASQTIPLITIAPIFTIWFGYDLTPRILITALACFFPLTINTAAGFSARDPEAERMFRTLGGTRTQCFIKLAVPTALPHIFTGVRIAVTLSVIGATISEWSGSSRGIGHLILIDTNELNTVRVFAAIIILSATGVFLFTAVAVLERLLMPWRHRSSKRSKKFRPSTRRKKRS